MKNFLIILFVFLTSFSFAQKKVVSNESFDLVILNGRVMDPETLFDDIANVGIKDGRIVVITKSPIKGAETVDATGKIVAPGFIDTHFHFQAPVGYSLRLRDGLTSSMDFEMGCAGSYVDGWNKAGCTFGLSMKTSPTSYCLLMFPEQLVAILPFSSTPS